MDIASLGLRIDTGQVVTGVQSLDKLTAAGAGAEKAAEGVGKAWTGASERLGSALASTVTQAKASQSAVDALANSTARAAQTAGAGAKNFGAFAAGQKLNAYQAQQLSFQLNDLFVQIASGQSPLTALVQQGSQLTGTFGGLGGTVRALGSVFSVARVAIGGLVGAIGALGLAYASGANQSAALQTAIALTGNAAGVTEGQFNALAKGIAESTKTTIGSTRETLQALVASGKFSGGALSETAAATQNLAKVTGQSTDDIVADFVKMSGSVARWATETNSKYHFLTAAQIEYIRTLEDQGDAQRAIEVLMAALNGRLETAAGKLGLLERAWNGVKAAASGAVDAMLSIGRATTPNDAVASIEAQIKSLDERRSQNPQQTAARRAALVENLKLAQAAVATEVQGAAASKARADTETARAAFLKLQDQLLSRSEQRAREIAKANALADKAGATPEQRAKVIAGINERFKDPKAPRGPKAPDTARADARAALLLQVEDGRTAGDALIAATDNRDRLLEARRQADLISDADYYAEKRSLIQQATAAQVAALEKENALLEGQKLNTKDSLDRDREVLRNKAKIAKLRESDTTNVEVLSIRERKAIDDLARAYRESQAAAVSYLEAVSRASKRETEGFGRGQKAREFDSGIGAIEDKFQERRDALQRDNRNGKFNDRQQEFAQELALINSTQEAEIAIYRAKYKTLAEIQADFAAGGREALRNYADEAANSFKQIEGAVSRAFQGMEDALVDFVTTGKLDFKSFAQSIIADLARIAVRQQITGPIAAAMSSGGGSGGGTDWFGALLSFFGSNAGKASGGPVSAGKLYPVNERGPELLTTGGKQYLMMGAQGGNITPNGGARPSGSDQQINLSQTFVLDQPASRATQAQVFTNANRGLQRALARGNA